MDIAGVIILGRILLGSVDRTTGKPAILDAWRSNGSVNGIETPQTYETPITTNPWDVLTGAGARDVEYTVVIDPESLAAYQEREATLKALRG